MIKGKKTAGLLLVPIIFCSFCNQQNRKLSSEDLYFGLKPPGSTPEIFAPGIVTSEHQEHSSLAISPDGREMWWSRWQLPHDLDLYPQVIMFIEYEEDGWGSPKVAPFSGRYRDGGPAFSTDGRKIFFYSRRPLDQEADEMHDNDLWFVERTPYGWGLPVNLGPVVNSPFVDAAPCLAGNGNLYFVSNRKQYDDPTGNNDLYVAVYRDGEYLSPEGLGPAINTSYARETCSYIAPDETYIIFDRDDRRFDTEGNHIDGTRKLMISFKDDQGKWQDAVEMGSAFYEVRFPSVSPDGRYLFFTKFTPGGHEDFYWVDTQIIRTLRSDPDRSD